ncbi:hypothetical protein BJX99DRAFT_80705 [Aspergillus californicus]
MFDHWPFASLPVPVATTTAAAVSGPTTTASTLPVTRTTQAGTSTATKTLSLGMNRKRQKARIGGFPANQAHMESEDSAGNRTAEESRKIEILKDLFIRLQIDGSDDHVLNEKQLKGVNVLEWWTTAYSLNKVVMPDCAVHEMKSFQLHHGNQFESYQFSLFQQLAEVDPVLWIIQSLFWSKGELIAFPRRHK